MHLSIQRRLQYALIIKSKIQDITQDLHCMARETDIEYMLYQQTVTVSQQLPLSLQDSVWKTQSITRPDALTSLEPLWWRAHHKQSISNMLLMEQTKYFKESWLKFGYAILMSYCMCTCETLQELGQAHVPNASILLCALLQTCYIQPVLCTQILYYNRESYQSIGL